MKNHFGEFDPKVLEVLKEAYNSDANSFAEGCDDTFDFKQCQRTDGTIYGVSDKSSCAQKGSKEVKPSEGGVGMFGATGKDNAKKAASGDLKIKSLGSQATIDLISEVSKANAKRSDKVKVIREAYDHLASLAKGEGKEVPTLTSIVPAGKLSALGLSPDKMNAKHESAAKTKAGAERAKVLQEERRIKGAVQKIEFMLKSGNSRQDAIDHFQKNASEYIQGFKDKGFNEYQSYKRGITASILALEREFDKITEEEVQKFAASLYDKNKDVSKMMSDAGLRAVEYGFNFSDLKSSQKSQEDAYKKATSQFGRKSSTPKPASKQYEFDRQSAQKEMREAAAQYVGDVMAGRMTARQAKNEVNMYASYLQKESGGAISASELRTQGKAVMWSRGVK